MAIFLILLLSGLAAGLLAPALLPWWSFAPLAFLLGAVFGRHGGRAFLAGLAGVGLLWLLVAGYTDVQNNSLLSNRIAALFSLPAGWMLVFISALLGGLLGGMATFSGFMLRYVFFPPRKRRRY